MKIKISEMLDNASEIIQGERHFEGMIESKKIKELVFRKIVESRRKKNIRRLVAVLAVVLIVCGVSVGAKSIMRSAGLIGTNSEQILTPQIGTKAEEDEGSNYIVDWESQINLILSDNLYENGIPIAKYIAEVSVDEENKIPECYVDNGAMLIFVGVNNTGWYVGAGTALQLGFQQERVEETDSDKAGILEVGYIHDGKVQWCQVTDSISNNIQLMVEEEGNYYICIRNASSDRIIITNGSIQEKKIQEE